MLYNVGPGQVVLHFDEVRSSRGKLNYYPKGYTLPFSRAPVMRSFRLSVLGLMINSFSPRNADTDMLAKQTFLGRQYKTTPDI